MKWTKTFLIYALFLIVLTSFSIPGTYASGRADLMIVSHHADLAQSVRITLYPSGQIVPVSLQPIQADLWFASLKPGTYRVAFVENDTVIKEEIVTLTPGDQTVIIDPRRSHTKLTGTSTITVRGDKLDLASLRQSTSNLHTVDHQTLKAVPTTRRLSIQDLLAETVPGAVRSHDDVAHVRGAEMAIGYNINGSSFLTATNPIFGLGPDPTVFRSLNIRTGAYDASTGWRFGGLLETTPQSGLGAGSWFGSIDIGGGNYATQNHRLALGTGGKTWGIFGQFSFLNTDEYFQPRARSVHHDHGRVIRGFIRTDWKPADAVGFGLNVFYNHGNLQIPIDPDLPHLEQDRTLDETGFLLENDLLLGGWVTEIRVGVMRLTDHHRVPSSGRSLTVTRRRDVLGTFDLTMSRTLNRQLKWEWGFQLRTVNLKETGDFTFIATDTPHTAHEHPTDLRAFHAVDEPTALPDEPVQFSHTGALTGLYTNVIFSPTPFLKITTGVRFDHIDLLETENAWSPRVNLLIHPPASPFSVLLSYNRLVWAPPVENYLLSSQLPGSLPIRPTTSNVLEAGFRYITNRLIVRTNAYYRTSDNVYHTITLAPLDVYLFQNFSHETVKAIETALTLRNVLPRTRFTLNYTLSWQTFRTPTVGGFTPDPDGLSVEFAAPMDQRHTLTFLGHWQPFDRLETNLSFTWASGLPAHEHEAMDSHTDEELMAMAMTHAHRLPSYLLVNVGIGFQLHRHPRTQIRLEVENLFDRIVPITEQSLFAPTQYLSRRKLLVTLHSSW